MINTLNDTEFNNFISSNETVIVDFYADWCSPCKLMMPLLEKFDENSPGKIAKVNIENSSNLAAKFGIRSIPTLISFKNSQVVSKKIGLLSKISDIENML